MNQDKPKLIVFDMDGVIVDVSRSYRDTVRQTASLFLRGALGHEHLPDPLFSLADLARVKQGGGLNNDWELTYHIIGRLLALTKPPEIIPKIDSWALHERFLAGLRLSDMARYLNSSPTPLAGLVETDRSAESQWVDRLSNGDVGTGNIIKQIFQEIYLGDKLFEETYGFPARVYRNRGYIDRESLLILPDHLVKLSKHHILAIATGRPKAEAIYALERFNLRECFKTTLTLDDCLAEETVRLKAGGPKASLSKPHPFMLDRIAGLYENEVDDFLYIGDMPDDIEAASRSRYAYRGVGIVHKAPDKEILQNTLLKAGAEVVLQDISQLVKVGIHY